MESPQLCSGRLEPGFFAAALCSWADWFCLAGLSYSGVGRLDRKAVSVVVVAIFWPSI